MNSREYILVTISNIDWNKEMSPWYMKRLFKSDEDYLGKADEYLMVLTCKIIPEVQGIIKNNLNLNIDYLAIAGYSLAGLFALYSIYKTNIFERLISVSGSLWYPNLLDYIQNNKLVNDPKFIYFSLGNTEKNTRNELMAVVEDNTKYIYNYYKNLNINTFLEFNEGNHFKDVNKRIATAIVKAINWEG